MRYLYRLSLIAFLLALGAAYRHTSPPRLVAEPASAEETASSDNAESLPPPRTEYMGRRIAATMSYHGAGWLIRSDREQEEHTQELLDALNVQPGQVVCDVGCGNGYYTLKLARLVGKGGRVLALDIQPEMLSLLSARAKKKGITNVTPILGTVADPKLPEEKIDILLLVDVYHEFSHPELMLRALRRSLKPDGRLVLVEFRGEDPAVPIKPLHKMTKKQILKELPANGFRLVEEYDELPWQHVMIFTPAPVVDDTEG